MFQDSLGWKSQLLQLALLRMAKLIWKPLYSAAVFVVCALTLVSALDIANLLKFTGNEMASLRSAENAPGDDALKLSVFA